MTNISSDGFYKLENREFYHSGFNRDLDDPKVIIEFGSYDGGDGIRFKKTYPNARVISIEADPLRCKMIRETNRELSIGLEVEECAISDIDGDLKFWRTLDPNEKSGIGSSGSLHQKTLKYRETYTHLRETQPFLVPSKTLKTLCRDLNITEIDLLHIDVEGAELRVLKGMGDLRPGTIFLEKHLGYEMYEGAYDSLEMHRYLQSLGYFLEEESPTDALYLRDKLT